MIEHHEECIASDAKRKAAFDAWHKRWPNACDDCGGAGGSSHGGSWDEPPSEEPCSTCTEKGICARCGEPGLTSEDRGDTSTGDGPCKACGWNYDDSEPARREEPCACEEEYMQEEGL